MTNTRPYVLGGALAFFALLAAVILVDVLPTVFFAVTLAYLLVGLRRRLEARGASRWLASLGATAAAGVGVVVVLAPLVVIVVLRLDDLVALAALVPDEVTVNLLGFTYRVTLDEALAVGLALARSLARAAATEGPVLLVKLSLAALLVFSLLVHGEEVGEALLALVPEPYRDAATALNRRSRETLFAIYVLQAATAVGTFLVALPVFWLLGYDFVVTLATAAAVLQFLPVVGPSLLVVGLAAYHLSVGDATAALVVLFVGGVFVAWLPDVLVRPRLARRTADLPGSLYFVGFVGGLLSLGPVGIIAGPLAVALVVEASNLLAAELDASDDAREGDGVGADADVGGGAASLTETRAPDSSGHEP